MALNDTLDHMDLTDIFRTFHPSSGIHILLHCTWKVLQNRSHTGTQISPPQVQKDRDHTMHILRTQHCETRNQPQGKMWKDNKYLETKEHPTKE